MAQVRTGMSDGLFWGLIATFFAALMAGLIGYVFGQFYGAGTVSGGALAVLIFVIAGTILAKTSVSLPPPNSVKAPVAPPGGAFRAPLGGAFRAPDAPPPSAARDNAPPAPPPSIEEVGHDMGEALGRASYTASAAVTSAAQAARAAIAGVVSSDRDAPSGERSAARSSDAPPAEVHEARPVAASAPAAEPVEAIRPTGMEGPRDGSPDDLKRIKGIGAHLEQHLNGMGVYHFDQIAGWGSAEIAWVDAFIEDFPGRASRDDWVGQARRLAAGGAGEPLEDERRDGH